MKLSNLKACVPDPSENFRSVEVVSSLEDELVPVYNAEGKKIASRPRRVVKRVPITDEVLENRGIDSSLFALKNQLASGVNMQPFSGDFMSPSLEQKQVMSEQMEKQVSAFLDNKDNYVEPSKD